MRYRPRKEMIIADALGRSPNTENNSDKTAHKDDHSLLYTALQVRILDHVMKTWCPATVVQKCKELRSYMVQTPNRNVLRRNRKHPRDIPNDVVHEKHTLAQTPTHQNTSQIESSEMKNQLMK